MALKNLTSCPSSIHGLLSAKGGRFNKLGEVGCIVVDSQLVV
jgi:hypothetical protein